MKKYFYFGKAPNGTMMPVFECVAEDDPPTPEQANAIYSEIVRQKGLGVPRPTHYAVLELHEVEQVIETDSSKPTLLRIQEEPNGVVH